MSDDATHVVIGATGALGSAIVRRLVEEGKPVRAVVRDKAKASRMLPASVEIALADALNERELKLALEGTGTAYHCLNAPYSKWKAVLPQATTRIIGILKGTGAKLVFPANLYPYGRIRGEATESHPATPNSKIGQRWHLLEYELSEAGRSGELPVVMPRFPDFIGTFVKSNLVQPLLNVAFEGKKATWPGKLDVPRNYIFVGDAAAACLLLGGSSDAYGQVWHVAGPGPLTGRRLLEMAFAADGHSPNIASTAGGLSRVLSLWAPAAPEVAESAYQFEEPFLINGSKFTAAFPDFRFTPYDEAMRLTAAAAKGSAV